MSRGSIGPLTGAPPGASPAEQVRMMLARWRTVGVPFEKAWARAIERVDWPHDTIHRHQWKAALRWSRPAFESSYNCAERDEDSLAAVFETMVA